MNTQRRAALAVSFLLLFGTAPEAAEKGAARLDAKGSAKRLDEPAPAKKEFPSQAEVYGVNKGDELLLKSGESVRLIGVDTPTAEYEQRVGTYYGKDAIDFVKNLAVGRNVRLEYGKQKRDMLGRPLAYVYLEDGRMLNELLIRDGLGVAACFPPNTQFCNKFSAIQQEAVAARRGIWKFDAKSWPAAERDGQSRSATVKLVLDGDTIQLDNKEVVRYIGIDAPESEKNYDDGSYGYAAYAANRRLVEGKKVRIELDVEQQDPARRTLAYVYVLDDAGQETFVNKALVESGYAWVAVFPPNVNRIGQLLEAQQKAADQGRGIWKAK